MFTVKRKMNKKCAGALSSHLKINDLTTVVTVDMVGAAGFEPTITGSKPDALPLGYAPI